MLDGVVGLNDLRSFLVKLAVFSVFLVQSLALCHFQAGAWGESMGFRAETHCLEAASESQTSCSCSACGSSAPSCESAKSCNSHSLPDGKLTLALPDALVFYAAVLVFEDDRRAIGPVAGAVVPPTPSVPLSLPLLI